MIKALFFDVDDTLLAFEPSAKLAYIETCEYFKVTFNNEIYQQYKQINRQLWQQHDKGLISRDELMLKRHQLVFGEDFDAKPFNDHFLSQIAKHAFLLEGAKETILDLSQKYTLFVASNSEYQLQSQRLQLAGIKDYFQAIFCSKEVGHAKPSKAFFEYCIKASGYKPQEIMMIGDNPATDIIGARAANLKTCYFNRHPQEKQQVDCDLEIFKLKDLLGSL
ncbi:MAG: HAD family hydrolase [Erysipelotrichaceae bacterium]|nr:HAD family hydrolase [Erysipelotrichaceae bacterium]MDY5252487.1 HAD family hydrolase [Erysipelotrichaceae bacterium]